MADVNFDSEAPADENAAAGLHRIATALRDLGNADAGTPMGAIEAYGALLKNDLVPSIVDAISTHGENIEAGLGDVADAIRELAKAIGGSK